MPADFLSRRAIDAVLIFPDDFKLKQEQDECCQSIIKHMHTHKQTCSCTHLEIANSCLLMEEFCEKESQDMVNRKQLLSPQKHEVQNHFGFGPLKTMPSGKKFILCVTDAFSKYAELVAIPNKSAATLVSALFSRWLCRHGLPLEIVSDVGKEFAMK
jgi:hypothetical protein